MHIIVDVKPHDDQKLIGLGQIDYDLGARTEQITHNPYTETNYVAGFQDLMIKLHYGNYGGYGLKIIYFVFGIITCFVILSGVLLWVEARDKRSNAVWKRKSNAWVASIFMAISLTMYPVTAFAFCVVKLFKETGDPLHHVLIYKAFFIPWLILSLCFAVKRDNYFTNKYNLLLGSLLGFAIPVVNGMVSGLWIWRTFNGQDLQIFVVDVFWLITSVVTLIIFFKLQNRSTKTY